MKKISNLIIAFLIGVVISGTTVFAATTLIASNRVSYDNSGSGLTATNVKDALDELYISAGKVLPIDPDTFQTNTAKTVYASSKGVCIKRNNKLNCFKINDFNNERTHLQEVLYDTSCISSGEGIDCYADDFICDLRTYGRVHCLDKSDYSRCIVSNNGSVDCT